MKKQIMKKTMACMLAAVMLVSATGCGKSDSGSNGKDAKDSVDKKELTYSAEKMSLDGMKGDVSSIDVLNDKLYINTYEWVEGTSGDEGAEDVKEDASKEEEETTEEATTEETTTEEAAGEDTATSEEGTENMDDEVVDGTSYTYMYSANLDGSDLKEIKMPEVDENEYMNQFFVNEDGTFSYLYSKYDEKKETSLYVLRVADDAGNVSSEVDITKTLNLGQESYFSKVLRDEDNNFVFVLESSVVIIDKDGKKLGEIKSEDNAWLEGAARTKDGKIIVASTGESKAYVTTIDTKNSKWGEKYELDLSYFSGSDSLMNGYGDYDFYYKDDNGIYGYVLADKKSTQLIDYMASNISTEDTYGMIPLPNGGFISNSWNSDGNGSTVYLYTKVDPSTIKDKETITIAMMWVDDDIKKAAMEFNQKSDKYNIEIKDYSSEEDPTTKMNADIAAGNVADIISLSNLPVEQYVQKGLLEDLTPYFEKDEEVKEEDIIDSLREAMKIDGKIYYVVPSFTISTLAGSTKDVGDQMGWTFDDMKKLLDDKGDGVRPFYSENKNDMLYTFAGNASTDFVDWTTGECSFDSQQFKDILEICNRGTNEETEYNEDSPSLPSLVQDGKVLFNEGSVTLEEIQVYRQMYKDGFTFIGYPDADKEGSYFSLNNNLGIYSKSKVKDGAWEFIRTFMTKDYQGKQVSNGNMWCVASRKDALDLQIQISQATKKFKDEYGQEHEPVDTTWGWDDLEVQIKPSTQEDVDLYKELINNTKKICDYNDQIVNIITEEAKSYFSGDKSVDDVADVIQNRVKTYVNENR